MYGTHKNAIHWTWIYTKRAKHALSVVDGETIDTEAFTDWTFFFVDIDAVNRTGGRAFVAADASREIEAVKATIARLHFQRNLWVFVDFSKRPSIVRLHHRQQRDVHALKYR